MLGVLGTPGREPLLELLTPEHDTPIQPYLDPIVEAHTPGGIHTPAPKTLEMATDMELIALAQLLDLLPQGLVSPTMPSGFPARVSTIKDQDPNPPSQLVDNS